MTIQYSEIPLHPEQNTIRLLTILPDENREKPVRCTLRIESLSASLEFKALKYTWGDESNIQNIIVNGRSTSVRDNLESALYHLQDEHQPVEIWVDALCIDQSNDVEKAIHIRRMHQIYSQATQTVVWLGAAADGGDLAIRALKETGKGARELGILNMDPARISMGNLNEDEARQYAVRRETLDDMARRVGWNYPFKAVHQLCKRTYWNRVWVLQEFTLAKHVLIQCGKDTMTTEEFAPAYMFFPLLFMYLVNNRTKEDEALPMDVNVDYELEVDEGGNVEARLWHLLNHPAVPRPASLIGLRRTYVSLIEERFALFTPAEYLMHLIERANVILDGEEARLGVSEPKDRIYGILGMLSTSSALKITVDYTISDEEVFVDVARVLLQVGQMRVLSYVAPHADGASMPSWAPDWRHDHMQPSVDGTLFRPAGNLFPQPVKFKNKNTLTLPCIPVCKLSYTGTTWNPTGLGMTFNWDAAMPLFNEIQTSVTAAENGNAIPLNMTPETWRQAIWRVPIADQNVNDIGLRVRAPAASTEKAWNLLQAGPQTLEESQKQWNESGLTEANFYQIAMGKLRHRRVIRLEDGLVGLGPETAREGDLVVIVPGLGSLLVLTPVIDEAEDDEDRAHFYTLVGDAYVHGVMDGEFVHEETLIESLDVR